MLSLTLLSIAILVGLSNSQTCFPADVCWGTSIDYSDYYDSYTYYYAAASDYDYTTKYSNKYICKDDGSICEAYYNTTDCSGNYSWCTDLNEMDEMYDLIMCMGCTSYVKVRDYDVSKSDCSDKSDDNWQEIISPTGCYELDRDTSFGGDYERTSCTATSYSTFSYEAAGCDTDGQIIGFTRNEGCTSLTRNTFYIEVLHCASCMHKPAFFIFIIIAIYLLY